MRKILGISAFYHDSAAALLVDGQIRSAAQEERFSRVKHDPRFPKHAIQFCLTQNGLDLSDIDAVVFYEKPFLKFERLIETYLAFAPKGFQSFRKALPLWLKEKLFQKDFLLKQLEELAGARFPEEKVFFSEHHLSHAASAFYPSPFEEALVLTLDGVGEWATTSVAVGRGGRLEIKKEIHFPHSLGLLYSAVTYYLGFKVNSGEYKVMGLAPYGQPKYKDRILEHLIDVKTDGSFRLNMEYFTFATDLKMVGSHFERLFSHPVRVPETDALTQFHKDMAASIQAVCDEVMLKLTRALFEEYRIPNLCLAGGVALNCVSNGKILKDGKFEKIWIQPAAGDAGGALGAALAFYHQELKRERNTVGDQMRGAYLGPDFDQARIDSELSQAQARFKNFPMEEVLNLTAEALENGLAVGWFQGPMEFGPRALGGRSILADARPIETQKRLNLKTKFRESFRPFAPSVLAEDLSQWFDLEVESPYMLLVANVLEKHQGKLPAVTHLDQSARIQTVHRETNPLYHALISRFKERTGCPVIVNTSFNVRGEPIVCSPTDAFRCFMGTDLDLLVCGTAVLKKSDQDAQVLKDYRSLYELD